VYIWVEVIQLLLSHVFLHSTRLLFHLQGSHSQCSADSRCHMVDYVCSKKPLVDPKAIEAFRKAMTGTLIYRNPQDYMRVSLVIFNTYVFIHYVAIDEWFISVSWQLLDRIFQFCHTDVCTKKNQLWRWELWHSYSTSSSWLGMICYTWLYYSTCASFYYIRARDHAKMGQNFRKPGNKINCGIINPLLISWFDK